MEDIFSRIKGQIDDFEIIVIGHLKWNPYFGETKDAPPRGDPSTCTSTMIRGKLENGKPFVLLIDPTLREKPEDYFFDINRRTGLHQEDITHCFTTHSHYDHIAGFNYFPQAEWCTQTEVAKELYDSPYIDGKKIKSVDGEFLPGIHTISLPGHRKNLYGIAFFSGKKRVIVTGDGVMTRSHFLHGTTMFEEDAVMAEKTIQSLKNTTDIVIPGHDNMIIVS